ncbi:MAG: transposase [Oligoflexales bacterium]
MTAFVYDSRLRIDNNYTEQQIRLSMFEFKNFLFTSQKENSVLSTFYLNKIHPEVYIEDIPYRINAGCLVQG